MEAKLCRLCGKIGSDFLHIFNTDGLKKKIETCLPLDVSQYSLLPDTICRECNKNVNNFHQFVKNVLQNTIILETQYNIHESSLKSKQKKEKGCMTDLTFMTNNKILQTDDFLDVTTGNNQSLESYINTFPSTVNFLKDRRPSYILGKIGLVDYSIESDSCQSESENEGTVILGEKLQTLNKINRLVDSVIPNPNKFSKIRYSNSCVSKLISEISQRKYLKRKNEDIEQINPKICRWDSTNRRKNKIPKKLEFPESVIDNSISLQRSGDSILTKTNDIEKNCEVPYSITENASLPVVSDTQNVMPLRCALCDNSYKKHKALVAHIFEIHGIDITSLSSFETTEWIGEKAIRKIPDLLRISDLKKCDIEGNQHITEVKSTQQQLLCLFCPAMFTEKDDLLQHFQSKHTFGNNLSHQSNALQSQTTKYICQICGCGNDNFRELENHVLVHDFLIKDCKEQMRIFDPADYIHCIDKSSKFSCTECGATDFETFQGFSSHRRSKHHIFHCDLCNKFYGRNSHLWKHVNRLHKGHPSITCQMCYKTSASKYHLVQHFNKMHLKNMKVNSEGDQIQKIKRGLIKQEDKITSENEDSTDYSDQDEPILEQYEIKQEIKEEPKEIDSSHDLYTNIITNYSPPQNEGEFKCPKCSKGFNKKLLLKKHRKNCRPRLQKDLLTRCKSCARVFKDRVSLAKHLVNYHSEYVCEFCNQKAQSKCEIVAHIRFQHPNCDLICKICNNILRSKDDLHEHLRNHLESYICQFCADSLPSKIKLKMHILSLHRKILSLSCGICLKLFETQHVLKEHVGIAHKDQLKPLTSCPVCGKNYGSKWKTYDHLNKSHGRIFKACKTCLEVFDNCAQLQAHCDVTLHSQGVNGNGAMNFLKSTMLSLMGVAVKEENEASEMEEVEESNNESGNDDESATITQPRATLSQNTKMSLLEQRLLGKPLTKPEPSNASKAPKNSKSEPKEDESQHPLVNSTNRMAYINTSIQESPFETKKDLKEYEHEQLGKRMFQMNTNIQKTSIETKKYQKEDETAQPVVNSSKRTVYVNSNDPSCCEICSKTWPAKKHLWQHYIRCHKAEAATVCGICLKMNKSYAALQVHLLQEHPTLLHGQGFGSKFICRVCGR